MTVNGTYTPPHLLLGHGAHPVIAIHGWLGTHRSYQPLWSVLDRERFTYAFVDGRGYGAARGVAGKFTIAEMAEDIVRVAAAHSWDEFSLIGHSMGGMAALRVLRDHPGRVRALVGLTPVAAEGATFDEEAWGLFSGAVEDLELRRKVFEITSGGRLSQTWVRDSAEQSMRDIDPSAMSSYLSSHANDGFAADVDGACVPMLVVVGEHDPAVTVDAVDAAWSGRYPELTVQTIGNAAHYPMEEVPVRLVTVVEEFLAGR
jgi:pimeloyl-ACP methyl ester carboxylesterase